MHSKQIRTLTASLCLAIGVGGCAMPQVNQISTGSEEQTTMFECPTPTPQSVGMVSGVEDSTGAAVQPAASPAEAVTGEVVELTAQQVLSREQRLDQVNAGPMRSRDAETLAEPPPPGTETQNGDATSTEPVRGDATPTPCP